MAGSRSGIEGLVAALDLVEGAVLAAEADGHLRAFAGGDFVDQIGNAGELAGADDQIDIGGPAEDELLVLLGHAAHDADDLFGVLLLEGPQAAEGGVGFVFGLFADGAGVEEDDVGRVELAGQLVTALAQVGDDHLAVQHVHLAADGFEIEPFGHAAFRFFLSSIFSWSSACFLRCCSSRASAESSAKTSSRRRRIRRHERRDGDERADAQEDPIPNVHVRPQQSSLGDLCSSRQSTEAMLPRFW